MNSIDFNNMIYQNYCIEIEMLDRLSVLSIKYNGILNESSNIALQEDVKDTIMTAIRKIVANIQEVWNKFKSAVISDSDKKILAQYEKYFTTDFVMKITKEGFQVPKLDEFNKFIDLNIPQFQNGMLDDLNSEEDFMKKYFSTYYQNDKSVKDIVNSKVFTETSEQNPIEVDKNNITEYKKFLDNYKSTIDAIAESIKILNSSSRNIENLLSTQTVADSAIDLNNTLKYYFSEAEDEEKKSDNSSGGFSNANPNQQQASSEKKEENNEKSKAIGKQVSLYFRLCNSILSTKMNTCNTARNSCFKIVREFGRQQVKISGENKNKEAEEKEQNNDNNTSGSTQVEV